MGFMGGLRPKPETLTPREKGLAFSIFHSRDDPYALGKILDLRRREVQGLGLCGRYLGSVRPSVQGLIWGFPKDCGHLFGGPYNKD